MYEIKIIYNAFLDKKTSCVKESKKSSGPTLKQNTNISTVMFTAVILLFVWSFPGREVAVLQALFS